jgi:hypothetical protein
MSPSLGTVHRLSNPDKNSTRIIKVKGCCDQPLQRLRDPLFVYVLT